MLVTLYYVCYVCVSSAAVVACLSRPMKEWGDFSDLFTELPVPPQVAGIVGTFQCTFIYIILSTTVSVFDIN